jgi:hypothetical protein
MVIETSRPIAQVARELGLVEGTLGNWVSSLRTRGAVVTYGLLFSGPRKAGSGKRAEGSGPRASGGANSRPVSRTWAGPGCGARRS